MSKPEAFLSQTKEPPKLISNIAETLGIGFNGKNKSANLVVHDSSFYDSVMNDGSLGLGESYMKGHWDCDCLDDFFTRILSLDIDKSVLNRNLIKNSFEYFRHKFFNLQSKLRANQIALAHYDIGNDVFEAMLDPTMSYSCGYWSNACTLEEAQKAKLDLICKKLNIKAGDHLLDIGCGWGGLAKYAYENFGAVVTAVTISKEQYKWTKSRLSNLPISFKLMDYRDIKGDFDKIVSVGMFEHVGRKNYKFFFQKITELLKDDGLFLLHTIGTQESVWHTDRWINRYIFPNGQIPNSNELLTAVSDSLTIEDWHNFGQDYDRTIMAWSEKFDQAWPDLFSKYDERFYRMWHYYLMCCAAYFRSRQGQLWQIVFSKRQQASVYRSVR